MISQATKMYQAGADLLRLASLALAADRLWEVGMNLVDASMRIIEGAETGKCPCHWAEPERCQDWRGEEACLRCLHVVV